ncbi:MAG: ribosome maturation factor RimM [Ornithinimicrobium sp.]
MSGSRDLVLVARIGKPHGLRGEVSVQVHTDAPDDRFRVGSVLATEPPDRGPLEIVSVRVHQGRYLLGFAGVEGREGAESLRNTRLYVPLDASAGSPSLPDGVAAGDSHGLAQEDSNTEAFYEDELVGASVRLVSGEVVGEVSALHTRPAQDLLEVTLSGGGSALVPFVAQLVPTVDIAAGVVVIDPPAGLLEAGQ